MSSGRLAISGLVLHMKRVVAGGGPPQVALHFWVCFAPRPQSRAWGQGTSNQRLVAVSLDSGPRNLKPSGALGFEALDRGRTRM